MERSTGTVTFLVPAAGRMGQVQGEFTECEDGSVTVFGPAKGRLWEVTPAGPMDGTAHFGDATPFTVDARASFTIPAAEVLRIDVGG